MKKAFISRVVCMVMTMFVGLSVYAVDIPMAAGSFFDINEATLNGCNIKNGVIENTKPNTGFSFEINNAQEQAYQLNFPASLASNRAAEVWVKFTIESEDASLKIEKECQITYTGNWNSFKNYTLAFGNLPVGKYQLTMSIVSLTNSGYAGNFKNFAMESYIDTAIEYVKKDSTDRPTYYTLQGVLLKDKPLKGIYIKRQNNQSVKVVE